MKTIKKGQVYNHKKLNSKFLVIKKALKKDSLGFFEIEMKCLDKKFTLIENVNKNFKLTDTYSLIKTNKRYRKRKIQIRTFY